jgi:hypothetical protein
MMPTSGIDQNPKTWETNLKLFIACSVAKKGSCSCIFEIKTGPILKEKKVDETMKLPVLVSGSSTNPFYLTTVYAVN